MAFVTSFERLGEQRGRETGKIEGRQEGAAITLQSQLTRKFGTLSDDIEHRIQTATSAQLETWSLNFVDADTLDEVFAE